MNFLGILSIASTNISENSSIQDCNEPTSIFKKSILEGQPVSKSKSHETAKWKDENAVKSLIKLWQDHESLFKSSVMKNAEVWRMISESLQKMNPNWIFNAVQCENEFKDLRRHYMATKDHNAQSGVQPKTCKFYDEMEEVLSMKPNIKPVATASSLKRRSTALESHSTSESDVSTEAQENSDSNNEEIKIDKKEKKVKKKTRLEHQLETWALFKWKHRKGKKHNKNDIRKVWKKRKGLLKLMKALCRNFLTNSKV